MYSQVQLYNMLKKEGIKLSFVYFLLKVKDGTIRPTKFEVRGTRRYPKYSRGYAEKLRRCIRDQKVIDWDEVKNL